MTHKSHDDEASFEGLISSDSVPPPRDGEDVHDALTAVVELPDSFLNELKIATKADVHAKETTKLAAFTGGAVDIETAFAQSLDTLPPMPVSAPMVSTPYMQPYPTPPAPVAVAAAAVAVAAPRRSVFQQLRAVGWREVTVAVLAVLMGFALALFIRALAARLLG